MVESGTHQQIGYILRSYPRLSQTFILNEILALEQIGVDIQIFALTDPQEPIVQTQVQQIRAPVVYLNAGQSRWARAKLHAAVFTRHPAGYLRALSYALRKREIDRGYTTSSRSECLHLAVALVHYLDENQQRLAIHHLHAHFAHDPTFIAQIAHMITGISYSFTAHARDLFQVSKSVLAERVNLASTVITCCQNNFNYLTELAPRQHAKLNMIYHGVDIHQFHPLLPIPATGPAEENALILSVGRLVEKKGFFDLLAALQRVQDSGCRFQCFIYGDGPLLPALQQWIEEHHLSDSVTLAGACTQQELVAIFQKATLFVLTPAVTDDGDRDGIPNVLAEAMAVGLPVISTSTGGISELITHNQNGLLYRPHDVDGIAAGLMDLLGDPSKREQLGRAARQRVTDQFDLFQAAARLEGLFSEARPALLSRKAR